jgi:hypothetical protein
MRNGEVRCPECGQIETDPEDHNWGSREDLVTSCGECGADYVLIRRVSVSYETRTLSPKPTVAEILEAVHEAIPDAFSDMSEPEGST